MFSPVVWPSMLGVVLMLVAALIFTLCVWPSDMIKACAFMKSSYPIPKSGHQITHSILFSQPNSQLPSTQLQVFQGANLSSQAEYVS